MYKLLTDINLAPKDGFKGFGNLGLVGKTGADSESLFGIFISSLIGIMTFIAFIWFIFILILGAIGIMTAGGDKQALESSRKQIVNGFIGLTIVFASLFIVSFISKVLGIDDLFNIGEIINLITN